MFSLEKGKKSLVLAFLGIIFSMSFLQIASAQSGKAIVPFEEGKLLTNDDISFLNLIASGIGNDANSRGASKEVMVGKSKFMSGSKISKDDAKAINELMKSDVEKNKSLVTSGPGEAPQVSRGAQDNYCGYCCYYYWWDYYCGCYRYRWYHCCAC